MYVVTSPPVDPLYAGNVSRTEKKYSWLFILIQQLCDLALKMNSNLNMGPGQHSVH